MRNVDQVALIDHSAEDRRIFLLFIFGLLFILWEGYWVLEVYEQYVARGRLELPYVFLFFMVVVVPLALYSFLRRKLRRSSQLISYADSLWRTPHDWLLRLHEYPGDLVRLSCKKCGRSGQYRKQKLIERHGADTRRPDLRQEL